MTETAGWQHQLQESIVGAGSQPTCPSALPWNCGDGHNFWKIWQHTLNHETSFDDCQLEKILETDPSR